jgi:hypothetical protein
MITTNDLLNGLPGEDLIRKGIDDWNHARISIESCLVAIASPRLERGRLIHRQPRGSERQAERELYRLLQAGEKPADAYSRYNALIRRLVSFERALDQRARLLQIY